LTGTATTPSPFSATLDSDQTEVIMSALRAALVALLFATPALAATPAYVDDRSTAVSVIQSYYNAITRKEYVRAYSYYEDGQGVDPFDKFHPGYANTASVTVTYGQVAC